MACETILSLIVFGGVVLGVTAGTATEIVLAKVGYQPKNYLAEWRGRWQAHATRSAFNSA